MREGWETRKLGDACILTMGQSPDSSTYNEAGNGMPFFQGCADFGVIHPTITTFCSAPKKIAEVDDVLMSVRAPIGTLNVANVQCCIGRGLASIRQKPGITIYKYLYYFISKSKKRLQDLGTGATFKAIGKETLVSFPIPVPPVQEQEKIVAELDCLTGIIEKKKQQLKELDKLAQSIFYDMFGDPITNEKGWVVKKLGEVCEIINGFAFKSQLFREDGDTILRISNIQDGYVDLSDAAHFNKTDYPKVKFEKYLVLPEDIVVALSGATTGKLGINRTGQKLYLNQRVAICREKGKVISHLYLLYFLKTQSASFLGDAAGVAQPNLSTEQMKTYQICIPSVDVQNLFAQKIEAIEKQKELIKKSIQETETLFHSRMDYWFN